MTATGASRPPAVADRFYPADPAELRRLVGRLLDGVPADRRRVPAVMVPHAGLQYSGACAAQVFGRIAWPDLVVILAPNHTGMGQAGRAGLWGAGGFRTPLGEVAVAEEVATELARRCPLVIVDEAAHRTEHAIEVELPFLQLLAPGARLLPLVVSWEDWPRCAELGRALAELIAQEPGRALLVASSDLTHYESAASAARKDRLVLARLEELDGQGLLETCRRESVSMCGRAPAATVAEAARRLGAGRGALLDYRHSGMVTGDDRDVVSYAGMLLGE